MKAKTPLLFVIILIDHDCGKNKYYFIEKHNCKVEGLYEEIDYLNKVVSQSKSNIIVQECLDLGFKKGTEGLKNCVLELN